MADKLPPPSSFTRLLERIGRELSPNWFARRQSARLRAERSRAVAEVLQDHRARSAARRLWRDEETRRFDAAGITPRTQGWLAPLTAPEAAGATYLDRLRQRSRDLGRNNPWAAKAVRAVSSHMVGSGIRATLEHDRPEVAKRAQELWDAWAESTEIDADGRTNLYGLQRVVARQVVEAGETLARMRLRRQTDGLTVPLQVQVLEIELLDSSRDTSFGGMLGSAADGPKNAIQGVEFDLRGRRVGYWLFPEHPARSLAAFGMSRLIPSDTVAHVYRVERPGQVRGIPWGASALLTLRDLGDWGDATILRAKLAACFTAFVTRSTNPDDPDAEDATPTGKDVEDLEPGLVEYLRADEQVTFSNPPGVEGMEEFPKLTLRAIAVAYGLPAHVLTGDLSDVNFSSARIGNLDFEADLQAAREDWLVPQFCAEVFRVWRDQAVRAGLLPEGVRASWTPPPAPLLEPKTDLEASKQRIRLGLSTLSEEQRRAGWRPRELLEEAAADWEAVDELELAFDSDPRQAAAGTPAANAGGAAPNAAEPADPNQDPTQDPPAPDPAAPPDPNAPPAE